MDVIRALDTFLFGPTLAYAVTSRYSPDETVDRIKRITHHRYYFWPPFHAGLCGWVDGGHVYVGWHTPWLHDGLQPMFYGALVTDARGSHLVGTIGFRPAWRAFAGALLATLLVAMVPLGATLPREMWWAAPILPAVWLLALAITSRVRAGDRQHIADALDAALA